MCDLPKDAIDAVVPGAGKFIDFMNDPVAGVRKAAIGFLKQTGTAISEPTKLHFNDPGFLATYAKVYALVLMVAIGLVLYNVAAAAELHEKIMSWPLFAGVMLLSMFAPLALHLASAAVDAATEPFTQSAARHLADLAGALANVDSIGGLIGDLFLAILAAIIALLLFLELLVRAGLLTILAVLAPVAAVSIIRPKMRHHGQRYLSVVQVILLIKPLVAIVIQLATAIVAVGKDHVASDVYTAIVILGVGVFMPGAILSWVLASGADTLSQMGSTRSRLSQTGPVVSTRRAVNRVRSR